MPINANIIVYITLNRRSIRLIFLTSARKHTFFGASTHFICVCAGIRKNTDVTHWRNENIRNIMKENEKYYLR